MKKMIGVLLAAVCAGWVAIAADEDIRYEWKVQASGLDDPTMGYEPLDNMPVYLFDANVCSPSNLIEQVKKGYPLRSLPFVMSKDVSDGTIATGNVFTYNKEPVGVEWDAYMALQVDSEIYISPAVRVMGLSMGLATTISFENLDESSITSMASLTYSGPGWYFFEDLGQTLCPGRGEDSMEVVADNAEMAVGIVTVRSPDTDIVSDVDYAKYFKLTATPKTAGLYSVRAELDKEAIELDKTVVSFAAQLSDLARKAGTAVTVEIVCKPGLSYRIVTASAVTGSYAKGEATPLTTGGKAEVKVNVPEGDKAFFKIGVSAREE